MSKNERKPVIGISAVASFDEKMYAQRVPYAQAVWAAGGEAIFLPCNPDKSNCKQIVSMLDGLLAPGGHDMDPQLFGEEKIAECGTFTRYEDEYDMELIKEAVKQKKPVLAICRGMQVVNAFYGGTLYQDIPTQYSKEIVHARIEENVERFHTVTIDSDSYLAKVLGKTEEVTVNTSHHQAVKEVAKGFKVTAKAPDGTIEAMESEDASVLCVQWHPERLQDMEMYQRLLSGFIARCLKKGNEI